MNNVASYLKSNFQQYLDSYAIDGQQQQVLVIIV